MKLFSPEIKFSYLPIYKEETGGIFNLVALPRLCAAIVILIFLSAFFSAAEIALTSMSRIHLRLLAQQYRFLRSSVDWVLADRNKALSAILIGDNLVNIASSAVATALALALWSTQGVFYAVAVMTVLIIIFGEVLPKCIALAKGEAILVIALPFLRVLGKIVSPLIWLMNRAAVLISSLTGLDLTTNDSTTKEEIDQVLKLGEEVGVLEEQERDMIDSVISFDETRVSEIMVPRTSMHILDSSGTVDEALFFMQKVGNSRVPVFTETPDNIIGIVLIKDLLFASAQNKNNDPVTTFMRKPLFVPETMRVSQLLKLMQSARMHMAIVVDEWGGTAGLATMEDLIEEIVGEIRDEYDAPDSRVIREPDGSYKIRAEISLEDLNDAIGSNFESEEADSLGGFLLEKFGDFPRVGDTLNVKNWTFLISSMGEHRIIDVNARKKDAPA